MRAVLWAVALSCVVAGCALAPPTPPQKDVSQPTVMVDTAVALRRADAPTRAALDVGIVVFSFANTNAADDLSKVRAVEARWMAQRLRRAMESAGAWGAVRVLPADNPMVPLQVFGRVLESDGSALTVAVEAVDSSGRRWLDAEFHARSRDDAYPVEGDQDPFDPLWAAVANRLLDRAQELQLRERQSLINISRLRHAQTLAPEAFAGFLAESDGLIRLQRLPAVDDPMMQRLQRIRDYEYLFIDTTDEQFLSLSEEVAPIYNAWRAATKAQADHLARYEDRLARREQRDRAGSFSQMYGAYATYRAVRIQEQDLYDFARGFANESEPMSLELDDQLIRLEGSLEQRYSQWQQLLSDIYRLESGLLGSGLNSGPEESP